jgi:hypothetical protein
MAKNTEYRDMMQKQLEKWDADVDALAAAGEKASEAARAGYASSVKSLRASRKEAQETFAEMQAASQLAGEKLQVKMTAAWDAMQKSLARMSADLRK